MVDFGRASFPVIDERIEFGLCFDVDDGIGLEFHIFSHIMCFGLHFLIIMINIHS